jgi:hypothetical protein
MIPMAEASKKAKAAARRPPAEGHFVTEKSVMMIEAGWLDTETGNPSNRSLPNARIEPDVERGDFPVPRV